MAYGVGKSLTVDILICNTVRRDQKRSSGSGSLCSSSAELFFIKKILKIHSCFVWSGVSSRRNQREIAFERLFGSLIFMSQESLYNMAFSSLLS